MQTNRDPYSDPDELFDVLDALGRPTGRAKRRADVHRDGDWHRALHCWVLDEHEAEPALLYQRRGAHKDTWPNRLDVTVGGHYGSGETLENVLREVEEEIGQRVRLDQLSALGVRVCVNERERGTLDRELQDVFLWRSRLPFDAYRPQPVEVTALVRAPLAAMLDLFGGQAERVAVRVLLPGGALREGAITQEDFIPGLDRYFYRVAVIADLALRGYPHLVI
jgi:isopentenyldiphosphate isomerase